MNARVMSGRQNRREIGPRVFLDFLEAAFEGGRPRPRAGRAVCPGGCVSSRLSSAGGINVCDTGSGERDGSGDKAVASGSAADT